jgi:uncharacterized membrane protein
MRKVIKLTSVISEVSGKMVDVTTEIIIHLPKEKVAEFASDPDNAPKWYVNIESVEWLTEKPLKAGSQLVFRAKFMGRHLQYIYEAVEYIPGQKLVMHTVNTAYVMETTYGWQAVDENTTCMTLCNRGIPPGLSKILTPIVAIAIKQTNHRDLKRLKLLLEKNVHTLQPM